MSYAEGFEDCLDVCISEVENAKDKNQALDTLKNYLVNVRKSKIKRVKTLLSCL